MIWQLLVCSGSIATNDRVYDTCRVARVTLQTFDRRSHGRQNNNNRKSPACMIHVCYRQLFYIKFENMKNKINELLFDFVNYYIDLHGINKKYYIENETIVEEFLKNRKMEIPRRNRLDLYTPAEMAIHLAMQEIEKLGADVNLTQAVQKLIEAKDLVSDYVDNKPKKIIHNFICRECGYSVGGILDNDTQMLNYIRSWTTHTHAILNTRCNKELEEVGEKEFLQFVMPE